MKKELLTEYAKNLAQISKKNTYINMVQTLKKNTYISMNDKLKKELKELIGNEIMTDNIQEDMTPIMAEVYHWGLENISQKEMKKIIKRHKK